MKNILRDAISDAASAALSHEMIGDNPNSIRVQMLLHRLTQDLPEEEGYLEVGCATGESFVAALRGRPAMKAFAVNGIAPPKKKESAEGEGSSEFRENVARYSNQLPEFKFFSKDFFKLIGTPKVFSASIGLYFYNGARLQSSYRAAMARSRAFLAQRAIVIFENWRLPGARLGTWEGVNSLRPSKLFFWEIPGGNPKDYAAFGNGLGCFYLELD